MRWPAWGLGAGAVLVGLLFERILIPAQINLAAAQAGEMSPAFFPRLVAWLIVAVGAAEMAVQILGGKGGAAEPRADGPASRGAIAAMAALVILWPLIAAQLGFAIALILGLGAIQYLLDAPRGAGGHLRVALVALLGTLAIFALFEWLLGVPLPRGRIW